MAQLCATRFIWAFELDGNRQLTEDMLRGFLEKQNVSYGMAIADLDIDALNMVSHSCIALLPLMRMTAIPPLPAGVAMAHIVPPIWGIIVAMI